MKKKIIICLFIFCCLSNLYSQDALTVEDAMLYIKGNIDDAKLPLTMLKTSFKDYHNKPGDDYITFESRLSISFSYSLISFDGCILKLRENYKTIIDSIYYDFYEEEYVEPSFVKIEEIESIITMNFGDINRIDYSNLPTVYDYKAPVEIAFKTYSGLELISGIENTTTTIYKDLSDLPYLLLRTSEYEKYYNKLSLIKPTSIKRVNNNNLTSSTMYIDLNSSAYPRLYNAFKFLVENCGAQKEKF